MFKKHKREAITLRRDLGLFDATLAGIGIIVGAGIYVLIGSAAGLAGNAVWLSFVISALVAFLTGLSYAELSSIYQDASGEYSYVEHGINKRVAFVVGFLVMISLVVGSAAVSLGFAGYLNELLRLDNLFLLAICSIIFFTGINLLGIKNSMKLNILLTGLSVLGLVFVIALSVPKLGSINYFEMASDLSGVFKAASLIFFAYIGFESIVKLSEETKNPTKTIPAALLLSLLISTALYISVAFSAISILGWEQLSKSNAPLADVAYAIMGSKAWLIVLIIAIVSTGNTILLSLIAMSRMLYSMSKKYVNLSFLSAVSKTTKTPHISVLISGALTIAFLFAGSLNTVAEITNFIVFVVFAAINISVIRLRFMRHRHEAFHEPVNIGKVPILALLGFAASVMMILNLSLNVILIGTAIIIAGFALTFVLKETEAEY